MLQRDCPARLTAAACYVAALGLACLVFLHIHPHPLSFLAGDNVYFEIGDTPQHVSGWLLYAKDAWHWPPLVTTMISPPGGVSIALSDSIPLAALLLKLFFPLLPENFHYFGLWHLLAYGLQATGAVFLIRSLGRRDMLSALSAALLALMWPAFLARFVHTALMTHGLILFALGFYVRISQGRWSAMRAGLLFGTLLIASLLIHPYLFAMVFALYAAALFDHQHLPERQPGYGISALAVCIAVAGLAIAFGYASSAASGATGFDTYSMDLLSPFCGGRILPCPAVDKTAPQSEGFNLLGAGGLLIIAAALALHARPGRLLQWCRRHAGLALLLVGFAVYSLGNSITLAGQPVAGYVVPWPLTIVSGVFRAAGRFFWPVGYAVSFLALAALLQRRSLLTALIISVALVLQWADTRPIRLKTADLLTLARPLDYSGWPSMAGRVEAIHVMPDYGCAPRIESMYYLYFQIVAGRLGIPINTGYLARPSGTCSEAVNSWSTDHRLHVMLEADSDITRSPATLDGLKSGECIRWTAWGGLMLCLKGATPADWEKLNIR
ncbi:DUF6311 domain-containing protein [Rhizobium oryzicola]|uniref:DUF6311 domain-containing protein n=1 Tax=Rhizobium oryzicola TaxID=1232668 RepID=A0ABT8T1T0_9HYPH|nr:DUF6311 domain-containing protein [Rhizobium oryzicola]MDO1584593.1 DUF6311 domain-containing protein [Rhizobium oryzicola]